MPKPTRQYLIQQRQFERRQKIYESKYRGRFYKYLISVNKLIAKEIELNGFGVDVSRFIKYEDLERIYKNLYNEVTINEAEIQYTELEPQEQIKQKDLIDDLVGILATESKPISLWRRLLNEFITVRIAGRITEVTDTTRRRISVLIEKGIEEGLGAREVAKTIREDQGYNRNRSLAIARTETITAANQGKYMAAISSKYVMLKKWLPAPNDGRNRLSHLDFLDRPWVEMEQLFFVANSDGVLEQGRFPCDVTLTASNVINCYLPNTIIKGNIKSAQRSFYSGEVIEIITRNRESLTVTPNHGILTNNGFVSAKDLKIGDNLVCDAEKVNRSISLIDNYIQKKFTAANIFRSLSVLFSPEKTMVVALDFDGDGESMNGNIDVINTERSLVCSRIANIFKGINNFFFKKTRLKSGFLRTFSPSHFFSSRNKSSLRRLVSFLILSFPLCFRHFVPFSFFRFGLVSKLDVIRFKESIDDGTRDTLFLSELINTNSVKISFDDIVNIRKFDFSGHVYDFSSVNGVNIANNIYTSNCRCIVIFKIKEDSNGKPIRKNTI